MKVACFGSSQGDAGDPTYDAMMEVGRLLARRNVLVMTGGFSGAGMEAPPRGAQEADGLSVGYVWRGRPGNHYLTDTVDCTYLQGCELPLEVQWGVRFGKLLTADAFIVAADGDPGTFVELMAVINLGAKVWQTPKRIAVLKPVQLTTPGWDTNMFQMLRSWSVLPERLEGYIMATSMPATAVDWVLAPRS